MRRGEIRWYKFKSPDKKRPALILDRDEIIEHLSEITIAPITTRIRDIPSEVHLSMVEDEVPRDSAVNLDHIQTVPKSRLGAMITMLSEQRMRQVANAIRFSLGF